MELFLVTALTPSVKFIPAAPENCLHPSWMLSNQLIDNIESQDDLTDEAKCPNTELLHFGTSHFTS